MGAKERISNMEAFKKKNPTISSFLSLHSVLAWIYEDNPAHCSALTNQLLKSGSLRMSSRPEQSLEWKEQHGKQMCSSSPGAGLGAEALDSDG